MAGTTSSPPRSASAARFARGCAGTSRISGPRSRHSCAPGYRVRLSYAVVAKSAATKQSSHRARDLLRTGLLRSARSDGGGARASAPLALARPEGVNLKRPRSTYASRIRRALLLLAVLPPARAAGLTADLGLASGPL